MNTRLSTEHVKNPDFLEAAAEVLQNARRLIASGCFEQAHAALDLLIQPGPWNASGSPVMKELEELVPLACRLANKPSPKVRHVPAMSTAQLAEWAEGRAEEVVGNLVVQTRFEAGKAAGENWSEAYLQSLPGIADKSARERAFNDFLADAEFVLKKRLEKAGVKSPHGIHSMPLRSPFGLAIRAVYAYVASGPKAASAAKATSTASIVHATAAYMRRTGTRSNKAIEFIFLAAAVLGLREERREDAVLAASALADSELGLATLVQAAVWPPLAELLRSGRCASAAGADRASAEEYLAALKRRPANASVAGSAKAAVPAGPDEPVSGEPESDEPGWMESLVLTRPLIATPVKSSKGPCSFDALRAALAATPLAGREIIEIPVLDTDERAYAITVDAREMEAMWKAARGRLESTQRWPVLVALWGGDEDLRDGELFSRFEYKEAPHAGDVSPRAILAAADTADVAKFLRERMQDNVYNEPIYDAMDSELESSTWHAGAAPAPQEAMKARIGGKLISTRYELDRWLLDWERAHAKPIDLDRVRQDWFDPDSVVLLFLPTPNSWDTLAYLHFFGSSYHGVENYIALGRQWQQRYGAELVAHFGTMLQCYVSRPPATDADAWQLAVEHDIAASCTLPQLGIALRHHAMGLIGYDRWFLHERP